jgi:hypothetical protein
LRWQKIIISVIVGAFFGFGAMFGTVILRIAEAESNWDWQAVVAFPATLADQLTEEGLYTKSKKVEVQALWYATFLLTFLEDDGETAAQMSLVGAFLGASAILTAEELRKRKKRLTKNLTSVA